MRHTIEILKQIHADWISFFQFLQPFVKEFDIEGRIFIDCKCERVSAFMEAGQTRNQLHKLKPVVFIKAEQRLCMFCEIFCDNGEDVEVNLIFLQQSDIVHDGVINRPVLCIKAELIHIQFVSVK